MTKIFGIILIAATVSAGSSAVVAQTRADRAYDASAQSWDNTRANRARNRVINRDPAHNWTNDVYEGSRYVGSDPSMQIRNELLRDREAYQ
jgi:hypothetical protein